VIGQPAGLVLFHPYVGKGLQLFEEVSYTGFLAFNGLMAFLGLMGWWAGLISLLARLAGGSGRMGLRMRRSFMSIFMTFRRERPSNEKLLPPSAEGPNFHYFSFWC